MRMNVGSKVIYPSQGPCLIDSVVQKQIADGAMSFYRLTLLDGSGGELFVPVEKVKELGLRPLLKRSQIPQLMGQLTKPAQIIRDWKQRAQGNLKLLTSGSAFDLAEVVESLTELNESKSLSFRESWMLEKAKRLLVSEVSEVMGETKTAAEEQVDQALNRRKMPEPDSVSL